MVSVGFVLPALEPINVEQAEKDVANECTRRKNNEVARGKERM